MGTLYEDQCTFLVASHPFLPRMASVSDKIIEKIKTHILFSVTFFLIMLFMRYCGKIL